MGNEVLRLKRALQECVRVENYDKAIEVRNEILKHTAKRENFEIIYETSRFEDSLVLGEPSKEYKEEMFMIELEEHQKREELDRKRAQYAA